jgi:hypothetical protein
VPVVAPEFSDPDGKRAVELAQKRQARALVQPAIEPPDTKPRAVIEGGVLKGPAAGDLHEFHVDLNAFARLRLLEQLHLPGDPLRGAAQAGQADISEDPLDRAHRHAHLVDPAQPQLGALRPVCQVSARLANELDDSGRNAAAAAPGIAWYQPLHGVLPPPHPPAPNRPGTDPASSRGRRGAMESREVQHHEPLSHPPPVLRPDLHIAESNHGPLLLDSSAAHLSGRGQS